jgi:thiol-disulfide isomerase/thioredoxin
MTSRRIVLIAGVAAAAAGLGVALSGNLLLKNDKSSDSLWNFTFDTPNNAPLSMTTLRGKPLILNFWAPWCPPCVRELPLLNDFQTRQPSSGMQVLALALDTREAVQKFLAQHPLTLPVALAGTAGITLARSLGNTRGALPYTVVFNAAGEVTHRKLGEIKAQDLVIWGA